MRLHWLVLAACIGLGACVPPPPYYNGYGYHYGYRQPYYQYQPYQYAPGYSYGYVPPYP